METVDPLDVDEGGGEFEGESLAQTFVFARLQRLQEGLKEVTVSLSSTRTHNHRARLTCTRTRRLLTYSLSDCSSSFTTRVLCCWLPPSLSQSFASSSSLLLLTRRTTRTRDRRRAQTAVFELDAAAAEAPPAPEQGSGVSFTALAAFFHRL